MSETSSAISHSVLTNTLTLSSSSQQLFSYTLNNACVQISMTDSDGPENIGSVYILISGGVAKNVCFTGGIDFSGSNDLYELPLSYAVYNDTDAESYTIWFDYIDNTIQVYNNSGDPTTTVTFVGTFVSGTDTFANNIYAVDTLIENNSGSGVSIANKVNMNGGDVNMGTNSDGNATISIGTDSSSGGRLVNIGNTVTGSSTVLNGVIETPNPSQDTITYNDSASITWTDINSTAQRIGKVCHVVIQATLTAEEDLTQGTIYDFFSVTPTDKYSSNYVVVGSAFESTVNAIGAVVGVSSSADFQIIMPIDLLTTNSTTIYASITYISN